MTETVINVKNTGKNRPTRSKTGKISGFLFLMFSLISSLIFSKSNLFHPLGGAFGHNIYPWKKDHIRQSTLVIKMGFDTNFENNLKTFLENLRLKVSKT